MKGHQSKLFLEFIHLKSWSQAIFPLVKEIPNLWNSNTNKLQGEMHDTGALPREFI